MPENPAPPPTVSSPTPAPTPNDSQARTWNMWCHMSALAGFVIPFGNIIGPLVVWQMKKNELPSVDAHGKQALNFQLTVAIALLAVAILAFILSFFCIGVLLVPVVIAIAWAGPIFAIIAGIKVNDGKDYKYPYTLTLIK